MTKKELKTRNKIEKILNNYATGWDGLDSYKLCVHELGELITKVSRVELPVKPANGKHIAEELIEKYDRLVFNNILGHPEAYPPYVHNNNKKILKGLLKEYSNSRLSV